MKIESNLANLTPAYMDVIYEGMYDNDDICKRLDSKFSCQKRFLFQYKKLVNAVTSELIFGQSVSQFGITFGSQIDDTAIAIGEKGVYYIIDINAQAIKRAEDKYGKLYKNLRFINSDAAYIKPQAIRDVVICFMLLSDVPQTRRQKIINNALQMLKPGGKAIFIDWHRPKFWHPLGWIVKMYNRLHRPFVEDFCSVSIKNSVSLTENNFEEFTWRQKLYFGGMFQKVVVTRNS